MGNGEPNPYTKTPRPTPDDLKGTDGKVRYFLEIFSGTGRMAKAVVKVQNGVVIHEFDLKHGPNGDLLCKDTRRRIKALISSGLCLGVWFGFPCGTFSRARRNDGKGAPPPAR